MNSQFPLFSLELREILHVEKVGEWDLLLLAAEKK